MASDPVEKRTLEQAVGEMTVLWNHCQALVFSLFFHSLGTELTRAQSMFFSIRSDDGQRRLATAALGSSEFAERAGKTINDLGKLAGLRNAFIHAIWDFSKAEASSWLDVWKKQVGTGDPVKICDGLISQLDRLHKELKSLDDESRTKSPPAQGSFALTLPVMPLRQAAAQAATTAIRAQQQPAAQSVPPQQQPSVQGQ